LTGLDFRPEITLDFQIEPDRVNEDLVEALDQLSPFGFGNPRPVAYLPKVEILNLRTIGKAKEHLSGQILSGSSEALSFVGFHQAEYAKKLQTGESVDMAATIGVNRFRGRETIQLQIKTLIAADQETVFHFEQAQETLVQHILQFHNSEKYDKIMRLTTMISMEAASDEKRCLVGMDSFENWLRIKETIRLRGRKGWMSHAFRLGQPDDQDKGWIVTYLPNERCFSQKWDQRAWMPRHPDQGMVGSLEWMPGMETLRAIYRWLLDAIRPSGILKRDLYRMLRVESPYELESCLLALWIFTDVGFLEQRGERLVRAQNIRKIDLSLHPLIQKIQQMKNEI